MHSAGWKDILRPIRDGFRHLFPPDDTGPTPEEREKQRQLDSLKGFTYFDTFGQLEEWAESSTDLLHRANTPLLPRPTIAPTGDKISARVLLCHDYSGNYHDYESVQGTGIDTESYACENLQYVDAFIYFSHKLICVPPPSWTNTLHRNGVQSLGTFLIEGSTEGVEKMLNHTEREKTKKAAHFPVASKLASIAHFYGFDGWLVNIEKSIPKESWNPGLLQDFLKELRNALGSTGRLIWYDALTTGNKVEYQNSLSPLNLPFMQSCGDLLTNYSWKEDHIARSKILARQNQISPEEMFFGVDVWAQNTTKISHPRVTYPTKGGGGTNTGLAVAKVAEEKLSVGIFAPAWSFEHFPNHGQAVDQHMWHGTELPEDLDCACGQTSKYHPPNDSNSIAQFAREYPAGSESFFYTDFSRAFARHDAQLYNLYNGKKWHSQLASQSILPYALQSTQLDNREVDSAVNILVGDLEEQPSRLVIYAESRALPGIVTSNVQAYDRSLRLFKVNMPADGSLELKVTFRFHLALRGADTSFYMKYSDGLRLIPVRGEDNEIQTLQIPVLRQGSTDEPSIDRLLEIGVRLTAPHIVPNQRCPVMKLKEICIAPCLRIQPSYTVSNLQLHRRGKDDTTHWRLCWTYRENDALHRESSTDSPYSHITGHFSYFLIEVNGLEVGRAYAVEYVLGQALVDLLSTTNGAQVEVSGIGFDGSLLGSTIGMLRLPGLL